MHSLDMFVYKVKTIIILKNLSFYGRPLKRELIVNFWNFLGILDFFYIENYVDLVHGPWTTTWCQSTMDMRR
jgi:hypothetical protein